MITRARLAVALPLAFVAIVVPGCGQPSNGPPSTRAEAAPRAPATVPPVVPSIAPEPGAAAATDGLEPAALGGIARLHRFGDIWLASQPSPEDLALAKAAGIRTVVNQRPEAEMKDFDERAAVASLGLAYANPGWNGPEQLTDEIIAETLELLRTAERPLLIHCASANRTGATWIVYRALDGGLDLDAAVAEARAVGLRTDAYERIARDYVERHR